MTDEMLQIGATYRLVGAANSDRFKCVATHDPNGTMFVRERDGMVYLGREFLEYRGGVRYYKVEVISAE